MDKEDLLMVIRTSTGPVELVGPESELIKFRDKIKDKNNWHKFIECPPHLLKWAPWLAGVSIQPSDVGVIVIQIPSLTPKRKQRYMPGPSNLFDPSKTSIFSEFHLPSYPFRLE